MDFAGRYVIPAPPEAVWDAIIDPNVLKVCIPGCQSLTKSDPTHFEAAVKLKIGPVSATFKGKVALEELDPPNRCVLIGEGQGGVAGFAKGAAEIHLTPEGESTILEYTAKASVGGKLAQVGQRLIDGAAKQLADEFFAKYADTVCNLQQSADTSSLEAEAVALAESEAAGVPMEPIATGATIPHMSPGGDAPVERGGLAPEVWVVGLIAVIVILLLLLGVVL